MTFTDKQSTLCLTTKQRDLSMDSSVRSAIDAGLAKVPKLILTDEGLGPWSVSTVKTLEKCPLKFFMDKIAKVKVPVLITESSVVTQVGRAAHYWVEQIVLGNSVRQALEMTEAEHRKEVPDEYWHMVSDLYGAMFQFEERMVRFRENNDIASIQPELKIGLDKNMKKTSFFSKDVYFRGVIDLPILLKANDVIIIDHKYGPDPKWGTKYYQKQFRAYKVLYNNGVRPVRGFQTGVHFMKHVDLVMDSYTPSSVVPSLAHDVVMDIKDAVETVRQAQTFDYNRTTLCEYCDYREMCKNGKRGTAGELQFIIDEAKPLMKIALENV